VTSGNSVTASVEVPVDPATAFEVFTDEIDTWYQRGPHSWMHPDRAVGIRIEPGVGGRVLELHDAEGSDGFAFGRITAWEPGTRFVFTDLISSTPPDLTEVEVRFETAGKGTRVTLEHRGLDLLPAEVAEQKRKYGWQTTLAWYGEHFHGVSGAGRERSTDRR
jgi:uncharacterized protein YndB with AHSA1/START domain